MEDKDVRWKQRFANFEKALAQLSEGINNNSSNPQDIIKEGIIQRFEFTHELAWKVMKDFLDYEGIKNIVGSRSATREAFNKGLIEAGQEWMNMIESRNETVHTYNAAILETQYNKIIVTYYSLLLQFYEKMKTFYNMKFGLQQETIDKINAVFKNIPEVDEAIIYGSRAKGNYRTGSDIDITLKGENLTSQILSKIIDEIDKLNTPYLFDISIFERLHATDLEEHVNRVGKIFYSKK